MKSAKKPFTIRRVTMEDCQSLNDALNSVVAEKFSLASIEPYALSVTEDHVRGSLQYDDPHWVAVDANNKVVGWCDIMRTQMHVLRHCGLLGIGLRYRWRAMGIGQLLMQTALDDARGKEFERIELYVYAYNQNAIAMYKKFGFVEEGRMVCTRKHNGKYDDTLLMAKLFLDPVPERSA